MENGDTALVGFVLSFSWWQYTE